MQKYAFNSTFKLWEHLSEKEEYELKISLIIIYASYTAENSPISRMFFTDFRHIDED